MKTSLAFIISLSVFAGAILVSESRPMKLPNTAVITSTVAPIPIFSKVPVVNDNEKASYLAADESFDSVKSKQSKYGVYLTSEDDVSGGTPIANHPQGHSPGVGH
ncbi:hypothetical protein SUGI_0700120 [Cryptomeria japonica]|nr:hypothetical protein SUGI_0700120 [Cryptomeria japonica]